MIMIIFKEGRFMEVEVNIESITSFGVYHTETFFRNGNFKRFFKKGFIEYEGTNVSCLPRHINELKTALTNKFTIEKEKVSVLKKDFSKAEAINWTYRVKNNPIISLEN